MGSTDAQELPQSDDNTTSKKVEDIQYFSERHSVASITVHVLLLGFQKWLKGVTLHLPVPFKNPKFLK